ncbi:ATP-binding cassette domain-containing protein [Acidiferrimicrobium sp. IK]|uniref:ATP-binding cassette domain-containing protein n=1 Tax=Acidiferrimicrobium sp. IK TaxID=2871700 RepID=UPI0021CAE915|nr:ATP-binding cassette domain-containing protein [Acidiferrimicrobium sp. IK]MCU4186715.1 ATP-binding cassette domain-containing protein [Acidiferrimicrobium sp. IK]
MPEHTAPAQPEPRPPASQPTAASTLAPILEGRDIHVTYGHVEALRGASFTAYPGEVVALIGDNGAGKSTLVKCLSGAETPDSGTIEVEGRPVTLPNPPAAQALGIETVYQDLALATDLDGSANVFLGREMLRPGLLGRLGVLDKAAMRARARQAFLELGVDLQDAGVPVGSLSGGQRQSVAVARAVAWASKVVFMDEPTAALGVVQTGKVIDVIRRVRDRGITVVLISHNMPQVLEIADRIEVLRLGRRVARFRADEVGVDDLVAAMTGAHVQEDAA